MGGNACHGCVMFTPFSGERGGRETKEGEEETGEGHDVATGNASSH